MNKDEIRKAAEQELREEQFRAAVEKEKDRLRNRRPLWDKLFPYKVVLIKKEK